MNERKLEFDFNWKLSLCVVLFLPVLLRLCVWQLERAEEKIALKAQWVSSQAAVPLEFDFYQSYENYQRVSMTGRYLVENYWLQENQISNGQLGYNVVMPFELVSGEVVAINRGWVAGTPMRDFVPEVPVPLGDVRVTGALITPSDSKLIREAEVSAKSWPHKVLEIDLKVMRHQSKLALYEKLLQIDADSGSALTVMWQPINVSPAKHYGYSLQWGLLGVALAVLYVFASTNLGQILFPKKHD
ncbi:MAG: SURF1 family protein [Agarilytica sp.]